MGDYGYGQNPYDQRDQRGYGQEYNDNQGYNREPAYGQPQNNGRENVEMQSFGGPRPNRQNGNFPLLDECREIKTEAEYIASESLAQLKSAQFKALADTDPSATSLAKRQLNDLSTKIMSQCRALSERVRQVKSSPEARNNARNKLHIESAEEKVREVLNEFQEAEAKHRNNISDQVKRQYMIVRPEATNEEVSQALESDGPVFSQALMQRDRSGQAHAVSQSLNDRKAAIQRVNDSLAELNIIVQQLDEMFIEQGEGVQKIEEMAEHAVTNIDQGNVHVEQAVVTARSTRKKKWYCLGIVVLIIIIVAIVLAVHFTNVNRPAAPAKRAIADVTGTAPASLKIRQMSRIMRRVEVPGHT